MSDTLDLLLKSDFKNVQDKKIKVKRLSTRENPCILSVKSLGYNKVADIRAIKGDETDIHIVLAGVTDPDFKNQALLDKYEAPTPSELVKKIFLPGEIEDIAREIEKLSGYRTNTIEELKKK